MKRSIFFLCIYGQAFGLLGMEPKPQIHHSRNRSISDPLLMSGFNGKPEGNRPRSPKEEIRKFALKNRFRYTGEYNPVKQEKTESES